jgi:hypothetical protein
MNAEHRSLADGRWTTISFLEQMANVGGEVERALNWTAKGNREYANRAFERALELIDLTLADSRNRLRSKEVARERAALVDFFQGANEFCSSPALLRNYYGAFALAARRDR